MQVMINGEPHEAQFRLERSSALLEGEQLYMGDQRVTRITHSHDDSIPVMVQVEDDILVQVDRGQFYSIEGIDYDWQPGTQASPLSGD